MDRCKKPKKIPYGVSDFEIIRKENYYYVDKIRFIESPAGMCEFLMRFIITLSTFFDG